MLFVSCSHQCRALKESQGTLFTASSILDALPDSWGKQRCSLCSVYLTSIPDLRCHELLRIPIYFYLRGFLLVDDWKCWLLCLKVVVFHCKCPFTLTTYLIAEAGKCSAMPVLRWLQASDRLPSDQCYGVLFDTDISGRYYSDISVCLNSYCVWWPHLVPAIYKGSCLELITELLEKLLRCWSLNEWPTFLI